MKRPVLAILIAAALAPAAFAQQPAPAQRQPQPTLEITAKVEAASLTIRQRGETKVRIWAEPGGEGVWELDRHGVPKPIPVGKTFRDVTLDLDARATVTQEGLEIDAEARAESGN